MSLTISKEGRKSMERKLETLEKELQNVRFYKNRTAVAIGNVWHDNNDFEQCEIDERRLSREIADIKEKLSKAKVIDEKDINSKIVNYGAVVEVSMKSDKVDNVLTVLLSDSEENSEYIKISANSPLGKTIFEKEVGFEGIYTVGDQKFTVKILKIEY